LSRHFAMLMPSPPAMPAAAAEAEDEESRPQARLASRILSGPGLWLDWLEQIDRRGLVEELLAEGIIDQAVATTNPLCGAGNSLSVIDLPVPPRTQPADNGRPSACFFLGTSSPQPHALFCMPRWGCNAAGNAGQNWRVCARRMVHRHGCWQGQSRRSVLWPPKACATLRDSCRSWHTRADPPICRRCGAGLWGVDAVPNGTFWTARERAWGYGRGWFPGGLVSAVAVAWGAAVTCLPSASLWQRSAPVADQPGASRRPDAGRRGLRLLPAGDREAAGWLPIARRPLIAGPAPRRRHRRSSPAGVSFG
jgi:hypothetical protein